MIWVILAMLLYASVMVVGAAGSRNAHAIVVATILGITSTIIPLILVIPDFHRKLGESNKFGMIMAAIEGVLVAFFSIALAKAFVSAKVGIVLPIVLGGAIFIATIASYFVYKEKVSLIQGAGLILLALGFIIVIYARATGK
jgi:multidrug transporter EmrE-like cation transporter